MEKTNYVFESPADEALFSALTPLSERTDVFPVVYGPEEAGSPKGRNYDTDGGNGRSGPF